MNVKQIIITSIINIILVAILSETVKSIIQKIINIIKLKTNKIRFKINKTKFLILNPYNKRIKNYKSKLLLSDYVKLEEKLENREYLSDVEQEAYNYIKQKTNLLLESRNAIIESMKKSKNIYNYKD